MRTRLFAAAAIAAISVSGSAMAQVALTGDFISTAVGERGTLGTGGGTSPGLIHDPTGTGTFGVNDYITPGTPHESFSISSDQTGFISNDNAGETDFATLSGPTLVAGPFANSATWTGTVAGVLEITNLYYFNDGDERVNITTTITALTNLSNLAFARGVDPDPDVNTGGGFATNNQRGNALFGVTDFVGSAGPTTGLTLGLLNLSGNLYAHNTRIDGFCCSPVDPFTVLGGSANNTVGDNSLNIAWLIGDLAAGSSASVTYAYVVGDDIEVVGGGGGVPEPATWAMMILGFLGVGVSARRRRALSA